MIAAALIRRQIGVLYEFESGEDVVRFVAIAASSAIVGATIGVASIALHDPVTLAEFAQNWWTWWAGDTAGIILVTPLILSWSVREPHVWTRRKKIEAAAFGLTLLVAARLIFGGDSGAFTVLPLVFLIPPIIIWAAFRLGQREVTLASAVACSVAIWYTIQGRGPFALASLNETLLLLLAFVSTVVMTGLVLSAIVAQRSRATEALQRALRDLAEQAIRDPMTGLYNRRFLREFLARELMRAKRAGIGLAVIMMDLDHFKRVNDSFGHDAGDLVLTEVAAMLRKSIRGSDMVCRFGGEEFVLVLTDATSASALRRCEEIRAAISRLAPDYRGKSARQSHGIVRRRLFPDHAADADGLINASDAALYEAKYAGRDRIVTSSRAQGRSRGRRNPPAAVTIRLSPGQRDRRPRDTMAAVSRQASFARIPMRVAAFACLAALLVGVGHPSEVQPWMILYIGPDLLLPFTSAIAAAVGVLLMFWHRLTGWVRSVWRTLFRRKA